MTKDVGDDNNVWKLLFPDHHDHLGGVQPLQQPGVSPHSWSWWSGNSNFQTLLSSSTSFVITISPYIHFLVVPLIRLYSWLLEWLDTIKMVMMVKKTIEFKHNHHPQQLWFLQLSPRITSWWCPWSSSTPGSQGAWPPPRWSWSTPNMLRSLVWSSLRSLVKGSWPKIDPQGLKVQILGTLYYIYSYAMD